MHKMRASDEDSKRTLIFCWRGELLQRHVGQTVPCTGTFGCSDVQNNQVEMGTTTPEGICDGQKDHCKGDVVSLS